MEDNIVKSADPEWLLKDKLNILNFQKILSCLGIFFSIVQATNLFLINGQEDNSIVFWFGVTTIFVTVLNILTLFWALRQTKKANTDISNNMSSSESTDNQFTRFVLFVTLIIFTAFTIYYFVYDFAQTDLTNQYSATHDQKDITNYIAYIANKAGWINFLSVSNIFIGIFTAFTAYSLASSALTHRLMIFLFAIISLYVCWQELIQEEVLTQVYSGAKYTFTDWVLRVITGVSIATIVFLILTFLANTRKLRIAYMILGAFFLIAIAVQLPATGQLFREYNSLTQKYQLNCIHELGKLNVKYVEGLGGCPNKYLYQPNKRSSCPDTPQDCFVSAGSCAKNNQYIVWEDSLVTSPSTNVVLACINQGCCGIAVNTYTRPILRAAALALAYIFCAFYLAIFTFQVSAMDKGDKQLHRSLQSFLWIVFILAFIIGIIAVNWGSNFQLDKKAAVSADVAVNVQPNKQISQYIAPKGCQDFSTFFQNALTTTGTNQIQFKNTNAVPTTATYVTSFGNLDDIADIKDNAANNQCQAAQQADCTGYILMIETPTITATTCQAKFEYKEKGEKKLFSVLSSATVQSLMGGPATDHYFGVIGTQEEISKVLSKDLKICSFDSTKCASSTLQFKVKVVKIPLTTWFNSSEVYTVPTTTSFTFENLHKRIQHKDIKEHGRHLTPAPATFSQANSKVVQFVIHDIKNDNPVKGAKVEVFTIPASGVTFNDNCDSSVFTTEPDFEAETKEDGLIEYTVDLTTAVNLAVYVTKKDWNDGCRQILALDITKLGRIVVQDIGIGEALADNTVQVFMQWDKGAKQSATDLTPLDLDLWATFGQYATGQPTPVFDCHVGFTSAECGGVQHNGDSQVKKLGNSSESITFKTIGRFNYLVYFNRYYSSLPALGTDGSARTATRWISDIIDFAPVLKYYVAGQSKPIITKKLSDILAFTASTATVPGVFTLKGDATSAITAKEVDAASKFDFLAFDIDGTSSVVPKAFTTTATGTATTSSVWSDLYSFPKGAQYNWADTVISSLPSTNTETGANWKWAVTGSTDTTAVQHTLVSMAV